jgi:hypothetical protein
VLPTFILAPMSTPGTGRGAGQGSGYLAYNRLTDTDTRKLSQAIDALVAPLSEVSAELVASQVGGTRQPRGADRQ